MTYPDGHEGWLVTGYAASRALLTDDRFSARAELRRSPLTTDPPQPALPGVLSGYDPPEHTRYRRLLIGQFTVRRMNRLTDRIEEIAEGRLDLMEEIGPPADLKQLYALAIPSLVICELLGVPYEERSLFQRQTEVMFDLSSSVEVMMGAVGAVTALVADTAARKRAEPGDDLLSGLVAGGELTEEELANIGMALLVAGHETTASMITLGTFALLSHPGQSAALRADPARVERAVEELMRYLTVSHIGPFRTALEDVEFEGQTIKAGDSVTVSLPAANRDPGHFADPDRLDIERDNVRHLGFGYGVHQCLGQQLARIEMRVALSALLRRFPDLRLAVPPDRIEPLPGMAVYGVRDLPVAW
ncbi:cytochrome P450 [Nocardiopsis mangrovi]|uniref:Cytochrome P450 n=1 Tax=Nocardiopsis mangrovi TaxID=1179818 RepID=A0ABV9DUS9_9ACTN